MLFRMHVPYEVCMQRPLAAENTGASDIPCTVHCRDLGKRSRTNGPEEVRGYKEVAGAARLSAHLSRSFVRMCVDEALITGVQLMEILRGNLSRFARIAVRLWQFDAISSGPRFSLRILLLR